MVKVEVCIQKIFSSAIHILEERIIKLHKKATFGTEQYFDAKASN